MGRRTVARLYQLNENESLAASFTTTPFTNSQVDNVGFMIGTSAVTDNTGTFAVEWRGFKENPDTSTPWVTLTLDTTVQLNNADDNILVNLNQLPPGQVRLSFTPAGGTPDGTANIWVTGNALGA
jgi:hypothetical protein